jgi:hypothetical protein
MLVVLKGTLTMSQHDGLGRVVPIVRHGPGQFTGEVAQLSGGVSLVDADADDDIEALLIPPDRIRALIVAEAELGERIVRALILRRIAHIESGGSGPVLIGEPQSPDMLRLEKFLRRNGQPHSAIDPSQDGAAASLLAQYGAGSQDVLVVCPNGLIALAPSEDSIARCLGMLDTLERRGVRCRGSRGRARRPRHRRVRSVGGTAGHCSRVPLVQGPSRRKCAHRELFRLSNWSWRAARGENHIMKHRSPQRQR